MLRKSHLCPNSSARHWRPGWGLDTTSPGLLRLSKRREWLPGSLGPESRAMDRFRALFQHFQSSSESVTNGLCLLLVGLTIKLYSSFDFNCPCLAHYNTLYGLGLLLMPPLALFLCGLLVNRQSVVMVEEWLRPVGHRRKDAGIIRCSPHPG